MPFPLFVACIPQVAIRKRFATWYYGVCFALVVDISLFSLCLPISQHQLCLGRGNLHNNLMLDEETVVDLLVAGKVIANAPGCDVLHIVLLREALIQLELAIVTAEDECSLGVKMHHACLDQAYLVAVYVKALPSSTV